MNPRGTRKEIRRIFFSADFLIELLITFSAHEIMAAASGLPPRQPQFYTMNGASTKENRASRP